jgi:pilus assembly protein CpaB
MNMKKLLVLTIALCLSGAAALVTLKKSSGPVTATQGPQVVYTDVAAAAKDIPAGSQIAAIDLKMIHIPRDAAPAGAFSATKDLAGRVTESAVYAGEPVTEKRLAPAGEHAGLAALLAPGMRAVSFPISQVVAVSGFIKPDSYVDILATIEPTETITEVRTRTILQNVRVLAVDDKFIKSADDKPTSFQMATVLVTPSDAEKIVYASNRAKLHLVLRSSSDHAPSNANGAGPESLSGFVPRPVPDHAPVRHEEPRPALPVAAPPQPKPTRTIEVLNGTVKTTVTNDQ